MKKTLGSLSNFIYKHALVTMISVLTIIALVSVFAIKQGANFSDASLKLNGTESQNALNIVKKDFSSVASDNATEKVVFKSKQGKLTDTKNVETINKFVQKEAKDPNVKGILTPAMQHNLTKKDTIGYATIIYKQKKSQLKDSSVKHLLTATNITKDSNIQTELTGDLTINKIDTGEKSEGYGIIAAIIILAVTFASLVTAGMPIISALMGLGLSIMVTMILSHYLTIVSADLSLSGMVGLAVGIDYGLFIISRYRKEIKNGLAKQDALYKAMTTAGKSVVFAGSMVIVALLAMSVLGIEFLSIMGLAGAISVLAALLTSLTFVPASLVLFGKLASGEKPNRVLKLLHLGNHNGWGKAIVKHKGLIALISTVALLVTAIPVAHINLGLPDDGNKSVNFTERRAYDLMKEGYGAGNNATLVVLAHTSSSSTATKAYEKIKNDKNVASSTAPMPGNNKTGSYYMMTITPKTDGNSVKTKQLVNQLRSQSNKHGLPKLLVTGVTAINIDMSNALTNALPKFAAIIVIFAFILLMLVFRSILIPLVAVFGFILSLLSTLGAMVFIVQDGHLQNLIGLSSKSAILNFAPVLVIGILFGLAMDYEVFLVSGIRETYEQTHNNKQAVLQGIANNGKAVLAAAFIMLAVFMGFVFAGDSTVKSIGIVLTLGIVFDAFVVRMLLVPAMISIFGEANWYLPKWLDKILPNVDVE